MNERGPHSSIPDGTSGDKIKSTGQDGANRSGSSPRLNQTGNYGEHLTFEPGAKVGRYRLLAPIASGGMAQVWAARPEGFGFARTIALKLIRQEYAADEEYVRMFIDEATVAAAIQHPNVCETYELGREEGVLFMALEWVAGDSLAGVLHRAEGMEPLSYRMAARIVADACAGLHAAHEATDADGHLLNVVHRDVSPPNILLSLHGQVKVSDFGIAKARYQLHSKTKTGEIKGKFSYIAPEQIGGKVVDRRADIFALGCVLYVATLGLRPFGSGPRAMGKILTGDYKRPSSLVENYPPELEVVIEKCLQRYPDNRYANADDMRHELERWLLNSGESIGPKDIANLVQTRIDPEKRRVTESLLRSNQVLADAIAVQLMRNEDNLTPTATSSVVFGPTADENRAPIPVQGRKSGEKPAVRFSPFASAPTSGRSEPDDTDINRENQSKETLRPSRLITNASTRDVSGTTLRDEISSRTDPSVKGAPASKQPDESKSLGDISGIDMQALGMGSYGWADLKSPQTWLAIGIFVAVGLIIALNWSSCHESSNDSVAPKTQSR
jgi:eukaryotic-like serine/threonine-protein kinase